MLRSLAFESGETSTLLQGSDGGYDIYWCELANEARVVVDAEPEASAAGGGGGA